MSRAVLPFICGALLGGGAVYTANRIDTGAASDPSTPNVPQEWADASAAAPDPRGERGDSETLGADAAAASAVVESEIERIVAQAVSDPGAALNALRTLAPPALQRNAALALLEALGNDDGTVLRIAELLPEGNRLSFRIDALGARALRDPTSALRSGLALDSAAARRLAVAAIAEAAAGVDPANALRQATLIADRGIQSLYVASVVQAWAENDPSAALAHIADAVPEQLSPRLAAPALDVVAAADHGMLLENLEGLPSGLQPIARRSAILAMAERDAQSALAEIEQLPPGRNRQELEVAFAELYALESSQAAVAWAATRAESQAVLGGAFYGAAAVDYAAAADLAMQYLETGPIWPVFALGESGAGDFGLIADRLLASNVPDAAGKMNALMVRWPQVDAKAALEWALANSDRLEEGWLHRLTLDGGREFPDLAIELLEHVPPSLRDDWIAGVTGGIAAFDSDRALAFLEQHRGEPGYDSGLAAIALSITSTDPAAAARFIDRTGAQSAGRVAFAWSQQDLAAAAEWVGGLEEPDLRRDAVMNLVGIWASNEPETALEWLLGLPEDDPARDLGLQSAIGSAAQRTGTLNVRALDAIQNDRAREQTAINAIIAIGRNDPDEARRLLDRHVEDAAARQQVLQRLAELRGGGDNVTNFISAIDVPR